MAVLNDRFSFKNDLVQLLGVEYFKEFKSCLKDLRINSIDRLKLIQEDEIVIIRQTKPQNNYRILKIIDDFTEHHRYNEIYKNNMRRSVIISVNRFDGKDRYTGNGDGFILKNNHEQKFDEKAIEDFNKRESVTFDDILNQFPFICITCNHVVHDIYDIKSKNWWNTESIMLVTSIWNDNTEFVLINDKFTVKYSNVFDIALICGSFNESFPKFRMISLSTTPADQQKIAIIGHYLVGTLYQRPQIQVARILTLNPDPDSPNTSWLDVKLHHGCSGSAVFSVAEKKFCGMVQAMHSTTSVGSIVNIDTTSKTDINSPLYSEATYVGYSNYIKLVQNRDNNNEQK